MTLPSAALRKLIDGLAELYEPAGAGDPAQVIRVITALIDADSCSYNEFRGSGVQRYRIEPAGVGDFPDSDRLFQQHLPEHPVLAHYAATGDGSALRVSDFLSDRQFRALGLHRDFYRPAARGLGRAGRVKHGTVLDPGLIPVARTFRPLF